ncbi:hypothetical protein SAY86_003367 [Trapa natans]|uniref:non-specific serine/threonine protein kinase n=1 Tax=Trapa natans TaxID=22666 RepID=A0AAN7MCM4_TRANT|nr:hypothetical protein SAY86_003367 [Trapa natans]
MMKEVSKSKPRSQLDSAAQCFLTAVVFVLLCLSHTAHAQRITDPDEARILNSIFQKWGIKAPEGQWNKSGELCSAQALDESSYSDYNKSPHIYCDCSNGSSNGSSTCHIAVLRVHALSISGTIPEELWNLTHLFLLDMGRNVLTGTVSPSIGNLNQMKYLDFGINALSGQLPKELGRLSKMITLAFGGNNFIGPLPPELGNLTQLEQLYFDACGVSGPLPSTFSKLQKLTIVYASGNELTGPIPDFIGSWIQLSVLRLFGNSFNGPIPSSLSTLINLSDLRISGILNGSSSLAFIKDMKKLQILLLRNNNISGSIPSTIGEYSSLTHLDLSFNNLHGEIPDSLFNLALFFLGLGNNSLNGTLPAQKSSYLVNIDVSYNFLTGSFPSWVNSKNNLNLNLVGNNFTITNANISIPPSGGLNCLQRDFPCHRGAPVYSSFAIKCGGKEMKSSKGVVYEGDNRALASNTYYVTDTKRWAVSNAGYFTDNSTANYIYTSGSQLTNTLDSELYETARISASSLRYYGLGLENGNYTVSINFAELAITNSNWQSLGRRVFDIYIQGNIVYKDFDIRKEAGGISLRGVVKNFTTSVRDNYMEIHLFWAGKGSCCIPDPGTYGPMISAISTTPNFRPTVSNNPPVIGNKNKVELLVGIIVGVVCFLAALLVFFLVRTRKLRRAYKEEELLEIDNRSCTFSYAELKAATNDFSPTNKLGEGGFGPVFKGTLNDGTTIAVKQLSLTSRHGKSQFATEIATISAVQHRNLVKLYGCCIEAEKRLIVYEYLENKSLDQALFGQTSLNLDWPTRYGICLGIARGLAYLHEDSRLRIVHRDVKASNILLDSKLTPKISDFGLAKLFDNKKSHISTGIAGTIGYLAPEYAMRGQLTEKSDIFAFGVVILEILSGRPNADESLGKERAYLFEWTWNLREQNRELELVDPRISDFNREEAKRMIDIGVLCTQTSPMRRPAMSRVVAMLVEDVEVPVVTTRPGYLTDWKYLDESMTRGSSQEVESMNSHHKAPSPSSTEGHPYLENAERPFMRGHIG